MESRQYWRPDAVLRLLIWLFVSMFTGSLLIMVFDHYAVAGGHVTSAQAKFFNLSVGMVAFHGAILALVHRLVREHETSWGQAFGFATPGLGRALVMAGATALLFLPIAWVLGELSARLMLLFRVEPVPQRAVETLREAVSIWQKLQFGVVAVLIAPVAEETLFRGVLYPALKQFCQPRAAVWITSVIFAANHSNMVTFIPLTVLAVILTGLYERTQNLMAPMVCHALFNAANFVWLLREFGQPPS